MVSNKIILLVQLLLICKLRLSVPRVQLCMKKINIRKILTSDNYSKDMVKSIMSGRRKPNADKRYEYLEKYKIPFKAWGNKSYLQNNDTTSSTNKSTTKN